MENEDHMSSYVAEYHCLSDCKHAVNVWNGAIFVLLAFADDVVLFDVVQTLLFTTQPE